MTARQPAPRRSLLKAIKAPFGYLEQREAERLRDIGLSHEDRWLVVVLRIRVDGRDNWCHDSIAELVRWTGISARELTRAIGGGAKSGEQGRLVKLKVVELGPASTVHGAAGHGGLRTYRPRRVRPFQHWLRPQDLAKSLAAPRRQSQRKQAPASAGEPAIPDEGEWLRQDGVPQVEHLAAPQDTLDYAPVALTPETPPEIFPERAAHLIKTWLARRDGLPFGDGLAGRWLGTAIGAELAAGADWGDIERAIVDHLEVEYADPRELGAWVSRARQERETLEAERQRHEEQQLRNRELDEVADRENADPSIAALKADLIARMHPSLRAVP